MKFKIIYGVLVSKIPISKSKAMRKKKRARDLVNADRNDSAFAWNNCKEIKSVAPFYLFDAIAILQQNFERSCVIQFYNFNLTLDFENLETSVLAVNKWNEFQKICFNSRGNQL